MERVAFISNQRKWESDKLPTDGTQPGTEPRRLLSQAEETKLFSDIHLKRREGSSSIELGQESPTQARKRDFHENFGRRLKELRVLVVKPGST